MSRSTTFEERAVASAPLHAAPGAAWTAPIDAPVPTPLFTRHMLGVIELERDERRRRRAAIRGGTDRYEPVAGVGEPKVEAVVAPAAPARALAAIDVDRWVDEGGSFGAGRYSDEGDEAMQFVISHEHAGAGAGTGG